MNDSLTNSGNYKYKKCIEDIQSTQKRTNLKSLMEESFNHLIGNYKYKSKQRNLHT